MASRYYLKDKIPGSISYWLEMKTERKTILLATIAKDEGILPSTVANPRSV